MSLQKYNFLDLFSGMGGFHKAATSVTAVKFNNVGAADVEPATKRFYKENYGIDPNHDINWYLENDIEERVNVIFAGFPCQPFSTAGNQTGFTHHKGNLFWVLNDVIEKYKPEFILLENVLNLKSHDNGNTWKTIYKTLSKNYWIPEDPIVYSPDKLGFPELRKRVYIPGFRKSVYRESIDFSKYTNKKEIKLRKLNNYKSNEQTKFEKLKESQEYVISAWNELLRELNYKMVRPAWGHMWNDQKHFLPYVEGKKMIEKNEIFYQENKDIIDAWKERHNFKNWMPSYKKLEWNVSNTGYKSIYEGIVQFRPSGIRVKKFTTLPTMVALNQTPFIGPWNRFITPNEVARIQGYGKIKYKNVTTNQMFKMLGNNVNVHVTKHIIEEMLNEK